MQEIVIKVLDDPTNGDMLQTIFPNTYVKEVRPDRYVLTIDSCGDRHYYSKNWWNAPYGGDINERSSN